MTDERDTVTTRSAREVFEDHLRTAREWYFEEDTMPCAPPVTTATWPSKSKGVALTRYLLSYQPSVT